MINYFHFIHKYLFCEHDTRQTEVVDWSHFAYEVVIVDSSGNLTWIKGSSKYWWIYCDYKKIQLMKLLCQYYFSKLSSSSEWTESASYAHGIKVSSPCDVGWGPLSWVQGPRCLMWFMVHCLAAVYKQRQGQLSQGQGKADQLSMVLWCQLTWFLWPPDVTQVTDSKDI